MATLRELLTKAKFNWGNGTIIVQYRQRRDYDYHTDNYQLLSDGWIDEVEGSMVLAHDHEILDRNAERMAMPMFIARDGTRIYFPGTYDGATWVESVEINIEKYLDFKKFPTPYVGGG